MGKLPVLILAACGLAAAQTQIDLNGNQVKNKPFTRVAIPGSTLGATAAALAAGSTLIVPSGTYTMSGAAILSHANVTIQCLAGATIQATANNLILFDVIASGVTFTGCTFTGNNTYTGIRFIAVENGGDNFTATWNTFKDDAYASGSYAFGIEGVPGGTTTGFTLRNNTYQHMGGGIFLGNVDQVNIQDEYCSDLSASLNCISASMAYGTFTNGANYYINNVHGTTIRRFGVEIGNFGYANTTVTNTHFSDISGDCISVPQANGTAASNSVSLIVENNICEGNSSVTSAFALETSGNGLRVKDNIITGPFETGIEWLGTGAEISGNSISGITGGFAIQTNPCCGTFTKNCLIEGNYGVNNLSGLIGALTDLSGCRFLNNHDSRAPGYHTGDSARIYQGTSLGVMTSPVLYAGNVFIALPPVNGYALPGTMTWACFSNQNTSSSAYPTTYRDNACENHNATAFGQAYYGGGGGGTTYANSLLTGNKYVNLAFIGNGVAYNTGTLLYYSNNQTLNGLGGSPATDFTVGATRIAAGLIANGAITGVTSLTASSITVPSIKSGATTNKDIAGFLSLDGAGQFTQTWPSGATHALGGLCTATAWGAAPAAGPITVYNPSTTTLQVKSLSGAADSGKGVMYICVFPEV